MLRILLADDHEIVRRGLRDLLAQQSDWQICGEATTGRQAVDMAVSLKPHIAILDLALPQLNGLDATRLIKKAAPSVEILIFTTHDSERTIRDVLAAGARGYVLKSDALGHIVAAVEALARHRPFLTWRASAIVLEGFLAHATEGDVPGGAPLTGREREVVQLLAEGNSSKKIAAILGISVKTVDTHRATIMRKLDAHTVVDVVHYAIRNNLVAP